MIKCLYTLYYSRLKKYYRIENLIYTEGLLKQTAEKGEELTLCFEPLPKQKHDRLLKLWNQMTRFTDFIYSDSGKALVKKHFCICTR